MLALIRSFIRNLFGAHEDAAQATEATKDAVELYNIWLGLPDLDPATRAVFMEGKDVLMEVLPILLSHQAGQKPTRAEKARLQSQLAEFTIAFGKLIDTLPTRD